MQNNIYFFQKKAYLHKSYNKLEINFEMSLLIFFA